MQYFLKTCLITLILMITNGCSTLGIDGGTSKTMYEKTTISVDNDGIETKTTETVSVETIQPKNPSENSYTDIDLKNGVIRQNLPGSAMPDIPSETSVTLGRMAFLGGIVIIAGGIIAAFYSLKTGITIGICGAIVTAVAVALDSAKEYLGLLFIVAIIAILIYGAITYLKWNKDKKALTQTKKAIDNTKKNPLVWSALKNELNKEQDSDVKKVIEKIK